MGNFYSRCFVGLVAAYTAAQFFWFFQGMSGEKNAMQVKSHLGRLAALTIQNFPDKAMLRANSFWKSLGRDRPILDLWGSAYELQSLEGGKRLFWCSAGPDKAWGTIDDIRVEIPYTEGAKISPEDLQKEPSFTSDTAQ